MHDAVTYKLCIFQSRDHAEYPFLLRPFQMGLESYQIIQGSRCVVLPQLHHRISFFTVAGVPEADGLQGAEAHGVLSPVGHFLYGHAAFEYIMLEVLYLGSFRCFQCFIKRNVFFFRVEGTVQVGRFPLVITGSPIDHIIIQGVPFHDRRRRIKKVQVICPYDTLYGFTERRRSQRTAGKNHQAFQPLRIRHFFFNNCYQGMLPDKFSYPTGKTFSVNCQGTAGRNLVCIRHFHDEGIQAPHFFFQKAHCVFHIGRPEGIAADQFCKIFCFMGRAGFAGTHFMKDHGNAPAYDLPRRLTARKPCPDNMDGPVCFCHFCHFPAPVKTGGTFVLLSSFLFIPLLDLIIS